MKIKKLYTITYRLKKAEEFHDYVYAETAGTAISKFMEDWKEKYHTDKDSYSNPDELKKISAEELCLVSDIIDR